MEILVIGNGFDLAHGLPTKYKDFLEFMKNIDRYETLSEESYRILIQCYENNVWLKYFYNHMQDIKGNWVDFESEISKVVKSMDYAKKMSTNMRKNSGKLIDFKTDTDKEKVYMEICEIKYSDKMATVYINDTSKRAVIIKDIDYCIKGLNNDLIELIYCLEIYLNEVMDNLSKKHIKEIPELIDKEFDRVLSFNYTNTFERLGYKLKKLKGKWDEINGGFSGSNPYEKQIDYIHGKVDLILHKAKEDSNMVLGIDEYLNDDEKNKELSFINFKKYFQRIYKRTGNEYVKWIEYMNKNNDKNILEEKDEFSNHIYFFGHSLDISDKDILKKLLLESGFIDEMGRYRDTTQIIIYYKDEETYAQQIANLVRIIGQDELISRVAGEKPTIVFKKQVDYKSEK